MKEYPFIEDLFTLSDCFKSKKKVNIKGIQVHSVGCKGTTMERWKRSWNRSGRDVCAGYLIDVNGLYRVLPDGKRVWLSGRGNAGNANDTHIGFEICEPAKDTAANAADLYGKTLFLCVYLCRKFNINPDNVKAHYELHAMGLASNHSDVRHWWGNKGTPWEPYTMDRLRFDIKKELNGMAENVVLPMKRGDKGGFVKILQEGLIARGFALPKSGADSDYGRETEKAVMEFQVSVGLPADGIVTQTVWDAMFCNVQHEEYGVFIPCAESDANTIAAALKNATIISTSVTNK